VFIRIFPIESDKLFKKSLKMFPKFLIFLVQLIIVSVHSQQTTIRPLPSMENRSLIGNFSNNKRKFSTTLNNLDRACLIIIPFKLNRTCYTDTMRSIIGIKNNNFESAGSNSNIARGMCLQDTSHQYVDLSDEV
jgi:hypothetical protein